MAGLLKDKGFEVTSVTNSSTMENNTVVISYTTNSLVVNKLTGLPFKYSLAIMKDDSQTAQVVVVLGKDYN